MSDCSIWCPPSSTSTLATSLTSPPAPIARPHFVDGDARHALGQLDRFADRELARLHVGDVAALDPAAFALAGAEHAQPPVGVARDDQRADLRRADVERGDEWLVRGTAACLRSAFGRGFGRRSPRPGARGRRTIILPGTRRSKRTIPRPSSPDERSILANLASAARAAALAFGKRDGLARSGTSRSQRRRPTQVADASCGFNVGTSASRRVQLPRLAVGAGTDQQRQVGHLVDRHAVEHDALGCRSARAAACPATSAAGSRSTMSITNVSGSRRDTRASLTQPNCSSRSRIARDVDQRHAPCDLWSSAISIDRHAASMRWMPWTSTPLDGEAGAADRLARRSRRPSTEFRARSARPRRSPAGRPGTPSRARRLARGLVDRQLAGDPLRHCAAAPPRLTGSRVDRRARTCAALIAAPRR